MDPYNLTKEEFIEADMSYGMYKEAFMINDHASDPVYTKGGTPLYIAMGREDEVVYPHIHIFKTEEDHINWRNGCCISLIENGYVWDGIHKESLTADEFDTVTKYIVNNPKLSYEKLCKLWNSYNAEDHIGQLITLPPAPPNYDYSTLTSFICFPNEAFM